MQIAASIGMRPRLMSADSTDREPNRWAVLALLSVAQLMVVLDATIVTIAIPSAQKALHFSTESRQWIVTAYALAFGSLLLLGGKLGDLFGRKWTLIAGLVGFSIASAIGGLAQSFGVLVAARTLQGAFGALLAPSALGLLTVTFEGSPDRPKAFGIFGAIAGGGASLGLILGGALTAGPVLALVPLRQPRDRRARRDRGAATAGQSRVLPSGNRSTYPGFSPRRWACSRSSTASPTPRPTPGVPRPRSWRSSPAPCSSRPSC